MACEDHAVVIDLESLTWPSTLHIPRRRFRLFIAADVVYVPTGIISAFARSALSRGMVYFCAWGQGCERFHDIVDEVVVKDELEDRVYVGPTAKDTIMTTWHSEDTLAEALEFFLRFSHPTEGFERDSRYWVALSFNNPEWAAEIRARLAQANL
jgi:hypothetical protein